MDRLDELAIFLSILDSGSFAAAARKLHKSPPAVTRALAGLEERLGVRLVERTTRRLAPTEAGRTLAERVRPLLATYDEAMDVAGDGGGVRGLLRVTAPLVFGRRHVTPIIANFLQAQPLVRIDFVLSDRWLDMVEEKIDVAVRIGALADSSLVARKVGEVRRVLVASPAYLAAHGTPRTPDELPTHELVTTSSNPLASEWRFGGGRKRELLIRVVPRLMVNEIDAMLIAVRAGRGIGRALSYQVANEIAAGTLVRVLPDFEPPPLAVQLVVPSARHLPTRTRAFLDDAAKSLRALDVIKPA
ncbi:LysR family transcriptional regulator [Roseiterribacter gracilis]|uniref:LysR family transcriptional regulator n=1 Tax=Roseiterribacter gracilis TaxID=2812848 RepID=A0A8S8XCA5_9PROT|nr:LysR family transcriptional regulator [Rhodospirillales bacterium TMPK1]